MSVGYCTLGGQGRSTCQWIVKYVSLLDSFPCAGFTGGTALRQHCFCLQNFDNTETNDNVTIATFVAGFTFVSKTLKWVPACIPYDPLLQPESHPIAE
jgi:hypothetical protein